MALVDPAAQRGRFRPFRRIQSFAPAAQRRLRLGACGGQPAVACRELDLVRVKGKKEPVSIFEPLGPAADLDAQTAEELAEYTEALAEYRTKNWDKAAKSLRNLSQRTDRALYNVYLDRIERFRREPPPVDWDGVFEHLTK